MSKDNLLLQQPFTRKIQTIIKYLAAELDIPHSGDELLFSILHYDFYNIPSEEVIKVSRRLSEKRDKISLRQYLREWHASQGLTLFTPAGEQALMEMSPLLESWIKETPALSLQQLYTLIINDTRIRAFIERSADQEIFQSLPLLLENTTVPAFIKQVGYPVLPAGRPQIAKMDGPFMSKLLAGFVMSVSSLNSYLDCPLSFFYRSLIRVPAGHTESMEFGSAVHHAVEKLFQRMQDHPQNTFPDTETFIADFNEYMEENRQYFTREAFEQRMAHGRKILTNYYNTYIHTWNKVVTVERIINKVEVNGVPIKGILDKLEFDGNKVNLVDYKSGSYEKALKKLQPPGEYNPNGGPYWRQAVFYKILLDNYKQKNWQVVSTEFDFIEPDAENVYHKEKVVISPADVTTVTQQITDTWEKIQQEDFYTGCGKPYCQWCNFVKENGLYTELT